MGDPKNPYPTSLLLAPGCRFYPSDEQLLCHYLAHKNNGDHPFEFDVIKEIDLYSYDPFDLPETACFRFGRGGRKRHWYCYAARVLKERGRRRAGGGYWKRSGRARDVVGGVAGKVLGTRNCFVFYLGESAQSAVRTDWVMYEYAQIDRDKASFVLCRVLVKSRSGKNISEHVLSSCGEESVATVRHIGVQHNGSIRSNSGETERHEENYVDHENKVLLFPTVLANEPDDRVTSGPVGKQTRSSGDISGGALIVDGLAARELTAIIEEDFIELDDLIASREEDFMELDDLVCPLPGID